MSTTELKQSSAIPFLARLSGSVRVWIVIVVLLALTKLVLDAFFPNAFADPDQAAFFQWVPLAIISTLGLIGVLLSERTGFPDALDQRVSNVSRFVLPILIGFGFAAILVAVDWTTHYTQLVAARHGLTQQYTGFVPMLLRFSGASVIVEVVYRLFPIPLILFLLSNLLLRGRWQSPIFWVLAALTSLLEVMTLAQDINVIPGLAMPIVVAETYAFNLTQATFFRRFGYLAAILLRVAYYFVWHVLYVH